MSSRRLRSASKTPAAVASSAPSPSNSTVPGVKLIPLGSSRLAGLLAPEVAILRQKQRKLTTNVSSTLEALPQGIPHLRNALEATLIFAQYEAGTAVCVDPAGWVLTCAHCFGDTEAEYESSSKRRWLLFYTGLAVQVECHAWDLTRDLALLKIVAVEADAVPEAFPFLAPATTPPVPGARIVCIGQPGQDDLESTSVRRTKYHLVEISEGAFRGMVPGADPQDNAEIGTLKHDAWTYWGHSGAPLVGKADGKLAGLHSSWDDQTAMRHGVPHAAITTFLEIHLGV
ncbi:AT hook domain-containing protein family protein [Mycena filopes]|nr:AT hook domain-containing protein family protein [Mycena filopes]